MVFSLVANTNRSQIVTMVKNHKDTLANEFLRQKFNEHLENKKRVFVGVGATVTMTLTFLTMPFGTLTFWKYF